MHDLKRDVFICHASEDKEAVVGPFVEACSQAGISCWYDRNEIKWGDSITQKVNDGLSKSRYVVVVFSSAFAGKNWPQRELNATLNQEAGTGEVRVLPLLVGNEQERKNILSRFPLLNDKSYCTWDGDSSEIVSALLSRIKQSDDRSKTIGSPVSNPPLPKIKKQFSQRDKDIFLRNSFTVIKNYFKDALQELEHHIEGVKTDFSDVHNFKFISTGYIRGDVANRCKIWLGSSFMVSNSISYQEGQLIDINSDNSYNDWLAVADDSQVLGLRPSGMWFGGQQYSRDKLLSAEQAAEYLWKRFIYKLEQNN